MAQQTKQKKENIFKLEDSFSGFSVNDVDAAREFYKDTLELEVADQEEGGIGIKLGSQSVYLYPKDNHQAATFTVLNLAVTDIDAAVAELSARGIEFESYGGDIATDENGVFRGGDQGSGPNIAWFKDPAGNILSVIESS